MIFKNIKIGSGSTVSFAGMNILMDIESLLSGADGHATPLAKAT